MRYVRTLLTTLLTAAALPAWGQEAPLVDHHQHLFSPALAELLSQPPAAAPLRRSPRAT